MVAALAVHATPFSCLRTTQAAASPFLGQPRLLHMPLTGSPRLQPFALPRTVALFGARKAKAKTVTKPVVIPSPSYAIPAVLLGTSGFLTYEGVRGPALAAGILGLFLAVQASRVRFRFEDNALEVVIGEQEKDSGSNAFVGGKNRWAYDSFVNWEFWWPNFPVLVYFKETQTKPEGQIHFFPIIFNGKQLYDVMVERCGSTQNSGPKQ